MEVKRLPFSLSLQGTSILLQTKSPNPSHMQTMRPASVAPFVRKCQAVEQTRFILAPSLGGQVFGRNGVSFTDGNSGT